MDIYDNLYLLDIDMIKALAEKHFEYNDFGRWNASTDDIIEFATAIEQAYLDKYVVVS